jgi:signal transduction histidine kinase
MTIDAGQYRARRVPRLRSVVVVPVAFGVMLAALLVTDQHQRGRLEADAVVRASVASAVVPVEAEIRREIAAATEPGPGAVLPVADVLHLPDVLAGAVTARDSGRPVLLDLARPPSVVVPVYAPGATPRSTADRRRSTVGYRMVPLSLGAVVSRLVPDGGGLAVLGPHRAVIAAPARMPTSVRTFSTSLHLPEATGWVVQAWVPDPATRGVTWVFAGGLLALFGSLAAAGMSLQGRAIRDEESRGRFVRQRTLISGMAPVVQSSLDLGEVAPAVAAHLVGTLGLGGLSLSAPSDVGERPLFSWGLTPDGRVVPGREPRARLMPGETFAVSLTRGGRILGILRVVAGQPLLRDDLDALVTATELLSSTLAHVEMFARQQQVVERLRVVDELKTVFLATASHELRTPVTAIVGFSTLLLDEWDTLDAAQGRMFMERVLTNSRDLESLIEQLLDFSRLERGVRPTDHELLDVGGTIAIILADRPELAAGHRLRADLPEGCLIRGSSAALERIVTNLVGNAAKYSPLGTRITVTVRPDEDRVSLIVDDEGPGVSDEDREHIFSRFYRGHGRPVSSTRGAGIGLAIVAEYAASMAGTATVEQAPAGGARFHIDFPSARTADAPRTGAPRVPCP